jgi:hypothetical protein
MKKIATAVALAVALGDIGFVSAADAAKTMQVNDKTYIDCRKNVFKERGYGSAWLTGVDQCYRGMPW